jgi:hypothetical protein
MILQNKSIPTRCADLTYLTQEGILRIRLLENSDIDLEESKKMQEVSLNITNNKQFVALIDARAKVTLSKESREWGSTPEAQKNMLAQAIVVNSLANKLVGNFIIQFHKPVAKTRLFSDEEIAMRWLKEQLRSRKMYDI